MSDELQGLHSHTFPPITDEDLARLGVDPQLIPFAVSTAQRAEQSSNGGPQLTPTEAENFVEILDRVVSSYTVNPGLKNRCFKVLRKVSPAHGILPKSYYLAAVILLDSIPYASGGFADVWKGQLDGCQVCVKAFRTQRIGNLGEIKRRFYRDIIGWKYIAHPNVVSFFGVSEALFSFCIISPWLSNGNIFDYIRKNPRVNRLTLLAQAACGLEYLHSLGIVHSDVNPGNILINDDGSACLGDFGLSVIFFTLGADRYMAPELLRPSQFNLKNSNPTKESDIYSLAVTSYEVLAEVFPYGNNRDGIIIFHVVSGDRPPRPENTQWLRDQIWDMITKCWSEQRETRWDIRTVVHQLSLSSIQEVAEAQKDVLGAVPESAPERQIAHPHVEPQLGRLGVMGQRSQGPPSDFRELQRVAQNFQPPPSKRNPFQRFRPSELFGRPHQKKLGTPTGIASQANEPGQLPAMIDGAPENLSGLKPSMYNLGYSPSLSVQRFGGSMEISAVLTSSSGIESDGSEPSSDPPPLNLAEINATCKDRVSQDYIDWLDVTLDHATCDQERHKLLNNLCKVCSRQRMLPNSMHVGGGLAGELVEAEHGCSSIVFQAQHNNRSVAVKTKRITMSADFDKCHSEFCREAIAWRHLRHPNILPLLGVDLQKNRLSMISEWMDHGNINEYVERHGGVNRLQLLADAARGLEYMHGLDMVHGDLKGANILINQSHRACLADFGLSTIVSVEQNTGPNASLISVVSKASLMSFAGGGTIRWMSPELLDPERFGANDDRPSKKSDCYALGMVVYEVLTGNSPFWNITNNVLLMLDIPNGHRPKKPDTAESLGFTSQLWKTLQQCWLANASARPDVRTILSHLNHATWSWGRR